MPRDSDPATTGLEDTLALERRATSAAGPEPEALKRIGPYRLLQPIGEGGMGEVWLAEQVEPVRRKVAVKVLKAGMDTKQVVARFEVERQALALMDHPAIAKVFDGGSTPEGRPYFVKTR
jgi:serine/threonine protein kinase